MSKAQAKPKRGFSNSKNVGSESVLNKGETTSLKSEGAEDAVKMEVTSSKEDKKMEVEDPCTKKESPDFENGMKKRENEGKNFSPRKRQRIHERGFQQPKNAICRLNELKRDVKYTFDPVSGPPHNPIFICSVIVNGEKFTSRGSSKKLAKHAAAELAMKSFIQLRETPSVFRPSGHAPVHIDFAADNLDSDSVNFSQPKHCPSVDENSFVRLKINSKLHKLAEIGKKDPLVLLNELCPSLPYRVIKEDPTSKEQRFVMSVTVDGEVFEATGPTKKAAKAAVAQAVLIQKCKINSFPVAIEPPLVSDVEVFNFPQILANKIGKLLDDTIDKVISGIKNCTKGDIYAGIVMSKDEAMENMQVICFATGSKHLSQENMSLIGAVLTDSHAEVVARRCLKDFFFTQLELHTLNKGQESIFEKVNERFRLKSNYRFHFYCTVAPCGDASFASEGDTTPTEGQRIATSGILQTKLESGSGTNQVEPGVKEQKVEAITDKKEIYQIMSCSDKFVMWNTLGIQGSLLNYFIEPVYFHSVILGKPFQSSNVAYSLYSRIESSLANLPPSFALHKPQLAHASVLAPKVSKPPQKICINWTCGLKHAELINSSTGKLADGYVSRLAKRSLFQRFIKLYKHPLLKDTPPLSEFYGSVKKASPGYDQAKGNVVKAFAYSGLGAWKEKPKEQDAFKISF